MSVPVGGCLLNGPHAFADQLRTHRLANDLTIEGLAELSRISDRTISDIERGVSVGPRASTVNALADALALTPESRDAFLRAARAGRRSAAPDEHVVDLAPHRLSDFRGRESEISQLTAIWSGSETSSVIPPFILSGPPGVGKTTIAVEAMHRSGRGDVMPVFLDLGGLDAIPLTPLQVLQALLKKVTGGRDESRTMADAAAAWSDAGEKARAVVILDDAAFEAQVRPVLAGAGRSAVVVTSRKSLAGLEGARRLAIGTLPRPESIRLLRSIIPAPQTASGDLDELAALCGDLPLALRIAGNRIAAQPSWTVEDFVRRIRKEERRLRTLVAGDIGIETAFEISYRYLSTPARVVFRRMALLRGSSFSVDLLRVVADIDEDSALDQLDELAELGLLEPLSGGRYRLHDLLRLYADQRLRDEESRADVDAHEARLGRWLLATARRAGAMFAPPTAPPSGLSDHTPSLTFASQRDAGRWLRDEGDYWFGEIRSARGQNRHSDFLEAVPDISWFGDRGLQWGRWHEFFQAAAASAAAEGDRGMEAEALNNLSYMYMHETFEYELSVEAGRRALQVATDSGDRAQTGWALTRIATAETRLDHGETVIATATAARTIFIEIGEVNGELEVRMILADQLMRTDPAAAYEQFAEVVESTTDSPDAPADDTRLGMRLNAMTQGARALLLQRRFDEAVELATQIIHFGDYANDPLRARGYRHRGFAYLGLGDDVRARQDLERALAMAGEQRPDFWADEIQDALDLMAPSSN